MYSEPHVHLDSYRHYGLAGLGMAIDVAKDRVSSIDMALAIIGFVCCIGWVSATSGWWILAAACAWLASVCLAVRNAQKGGRVPALVWCWVIVGAVLAFAFLVGLRTALP